MPKLSKKTIQKIILGSYLVSLFLLAVGFLVATSKTTKIVESRVTFLGNKEDSNTLVSRVAGESQNVPRLINPQAPPPKLTAQASLLIDYASGAILFQKNIHQPLPPASTTKIMTALVGIEYFKPADSLIVPPQALVGGSSMGVVAGEQLTFRGLLYGMMLNSGNDAAYSIALNYPGGLESFIERMNQKAQSLGLKNTHFTNPAGFDAPGHFSTASDLVKIARVVVDDPQLSKVVSTKETSVISLDNKQSHFLRNINKLLSENGVVGIKTGYTKSSGENLVGLVERDDHKLLTVILHSQDRFGETKALIDWVDNNFTWRGRNQ